jgi:hypothetical protein
MIIISIMRGRKPLNRDENEACNIASKVGTREKLRTFGSMGESFDEVIWMLIEFYEENQNKVGSGEQPAITATNAGGETQDVNAIMA